MDLDAVDMVCLDCDGVIWLGETPIAGALETLQSLAAAGKELTFVSNNSMYSQAEFEAKFERLGFGEFVRPGALLSSVGSMQAFLEQQPLPTDRSAFVIGSDGLKAAVRASGVRIDDGPTGEQLGFGPIEMANVPVDASIGAVLVGFEKAFCYQKLAFAVRCLLENEGCRFVVTNRDYQFPAKGRKLPGTGTLVAAIVAGVRREPDAVTAKPSPFMLNALQRRFGIDAERTLMVGDLWSDVAFGHRAGARAVMVLSGVTKLAEARDLTGDSAPDAIAADVRGLIDRAHVVAPLAPLAPRRATLVPTLRHHAVAAVGRRPVGFAATGVALAALGVGLAAAARGRARDA